MGMIKNSLVRVVRIETLVLRGCGTVVVKPVPLSFSVLAWLRFGFRVLFLFLTDAFTLVFASETHNWRFQA